jgi:hypothetical protein
MTRNALSIVALGLRIPATVIAKVKIATMNLRQSSKRDLQWRTPTGITPTSAVNEYCKHVATYSTKELPCTTSAAEAEAVHPVLPVK